jgi:hemerythrin-like domain-containing protein
MGASEPTIVKADVTTYLIRDHGRLDAVLERVSCAVDEGRFDAARHDFAGYEADLLRHHRIEEELLFPVFEARSGIEGGPTAVLRDEHDQLSASLALMRRALKSEDPAAYGDGRRFLEGVLPAHNAKEEHILYPALDLLLSAAECRRLVTRLQEETKR